MAEQNEEFMITIDEALSWLNQFDRSHLRKATTSLLVHMKGVYIPEEKQQQMISAAIRYARSNKDPFELPEVLLVCAEEQYSREEFIVARDLANTVVQFYPQESHPAGVTQWILGIVHGELPNYLQRYPCWHRARGIFEGLKARAADFQNLEMLDWYARSLTKMNSDMLGTVEEPYTWLDYFEASHLSSGTRLLNEKIIQELCDNLWDDAVKSMQALQSLADNSPDPLETAEALVECALASYRMGEIEEASLLLKESFDLFNPSSLQQAAVEWMLGIVQQHRENSRQFTAVCWSKSINIFEELVQGDGANSLGGQLAWYREKLENMKLALKRKIAEIRS